MNKKGISVIVASVLLILLAVILSVVIYEKTKEVIVSFSPEVDCYGLDFRAEIIREPSANYLDVVNLGNLQIEGFYIKVYSGGEVVIYEEVLRTLEPGADDRIALTKDYGPGRYLIVPRVEGEDLEGESYFKACKDVYGQEILLD
jgi:hypothetical protein